MRRRGFVSAGCWTLDRIKLVDRWPAEEELATIVGNEQQGGGSAHNFAIDMRRLDPTMPVAGMGLVGNDDAGTFLYTQADSHGVDLQQLHRCGDRQTSYTDVVSVLNTGRRTFFHHAGTNDCLTPTHLDLTGSQARILHLGLLGLHRRLDQPWQDDPNGWVTVLKTARAAGLETNIELVSIDTDTNRRIALPCLAHVDTLILNDQEAGGLTGRRTLVDERADPSECLRAARQLLDMGVMDLVVVHFPEGAVLAERGGRTLSSPSLSLPDGWIVGSTGAGDAFAAGFLHARHEGESSEDSLRLAHAVAASSLRSATTTESVGSLAECRDLLANHDSRTI